MTDRYARALTQRLYLLEEVYPNLQDEKDSQPSWFGFDVQGSTGNEYHLSFATVQQSDTDILSKDNKMFMSCTCPDFQKRQLQCKHLLFALCRVLHCQNNPDSAEIRKRAAERKEKLDKGLDNDDEESEGGVKQKELTEDADCGICLERLTGSNEPLFYCYKTCGQSVHMACQKRWAERNGNCVYCKAEYTIESLTSPTKNSYLSKKRKPTQVQNEQKSLEQHQLETESEQQIVKKEKSE